MKIHTMKQGSDEWVNARLGIPTASQFGRIFTPGGRPSSAADDYLCQLLAERLLGVPVDVSSEYMERGRGLEPDAVAFYEFERDADTTPVGFVTSDDGLVGCSPDRLVGDDGGLEIKIPSAKVHISYMLEGMLDGRYKPQVQGGLWVSGRRWWDTLSYHPGLRPALFRVERDEPYIAALAKEVYAFASRLQRAHDQLKQEIP